MSEIEIQKKGHLLIAREEALNLKIQIEGLRKSLLLALDELAKIEDLPADIIASQAVEFATKHSRYIEVLSDIKAAEKALGRGR